MKLKIMEDRETDFIILAGIRYGIGRASYAPGLICDWIKRHWPELSSNLKTLIKRDITEEIRLWERMGDRPYGDSCNAGIWRNLVMWLEDK